VYLNWESPVGIYQPQADDRNVEEYLFDPHVGSISPYLMARYKRGEFVMYYESESVEKFMMDHEETLVYCRDGNFFVYSSL
jgi:hypothetical protein